MELVIDGQMRRFIPIKEFRTSHNLTYDFGVQHFSPPTTAGGLRHLSGVQAELQVIRAAVLDAIPQKLPASEWPGYLPDVTMLFENKLDEVNPQLGLGDREIDYATTGFTEMCEALIYAIIRAQAAGDPLPQPETIYRRWINEAVSIGTETHSYIHRGAVWAVQVVSTAYGRVGLIIWTDTATHYVHDPTLTCPAESFMNTLFDEVATRILASVKG